MLAMSGKVWSTSCRGLSLALAVALSSSLPAVSRGAEETNTSNIQVLQQQLLTVNSQIDDAQRELNSLPNPNYCCCAGAFILAPIIGGIFWYFVDIKPKQDKRNQLQARIQSLTSERQSLVAQIVLLQES